MLWVMLGNLCVGGSARGLEPHSHGFGTPLLHPSLKCWAYPLPLAWAMGVGDSNICHMSIP